MNRTLEEGCKVVQINLMKTILLMVEQSLVPLFLKFKQIGIGDRAQYSNLYWFSFG